MEEEAAFIDLKRSEKRYIVTETSYENRFLAKELGRDGMYNENGSLISFI
ncbi:hypothetical protein NDS46_31755 (plasmid) [Paenibacillus thiaminolyticus]|nr:hypothetical protein [Paenibacillus thiaminolyticus]WCF11534.1 hypothetical protein NDS46_31755 [Paenibacillus thiaminolyticus]